MPEAGLPRMAGEGVTGFQAEATRLLRDAQVAGAASEVDEVDCRARFRRSFDFVMRQGEVVLNAVPAEGRRLRSW